MNKPVPVISLEHSNRLDLHSPDLDALLNRIAEGASDRERERTLPFPEIDLIRKARLGALRLPAAASLDFHGEELTSHDRLANQPFSSPFASELLCGMVH